MQTGIYALVAFNVHGDLGSGLQVLVSRVLVASQISPEHVILLPRWYPLLKFSQTVGTNFPSRLFLSGAADLHFHTVHRAIIRAHTVPKISAYEAGLGCSLPCNELLIVRKSVRQART